ncbi:MAG TPA: alginate lyase family protein, partial [Sediminibacterium sp.]|nr:alginate lyase family protein [Sediminibacterium sp.]
KPLPVDTILSEGHLVTDPKKIRTMQSLGDMQKLYALAYTYAVTGRQNYRDKARDFLLAWAKTNHGIGNPINDTKLEPAIEAFDLLKHTLKASDKMIVETWLKQVADQEIQVFLSRKSNKSTYNNWHSHRIKVVGMIAYALDDRGFQAFTDSSLRTQISKNLYPDGSGMDFEDRDALHYHIYTLEPLLKIAIVIRRATGTDFYHYLSPAASSISKSVQFLVPFVRGEKIHREFVNSKVSFDKKRADNKEPGYTIGAEFQPATAVEMLSLAAYFDKSFNSIVRQLLHRDEPYPDWQLLLNASETRLVTQP